jgi:hypothetical protein
MPDKVFAINEINEIERAYTHGATVLGFAAAGLLQRWQYGLRDEETLIRLIFLFWYSRTEPTDLTGLDQFNVDEISVEDLIDGFGGEDRLSAESRFIIAILGHSAYAFGLGDEAEWEKKSLQYFDDACRIEPQSALFSDWKFLIGEAKNSRNLKAKIETEIHARFRGRGYMGDYLVHVLSGMTRPNRVAVNRA